MTTEAEDTKTRFFKNLNQITSNLIHVFGLEFSQEIRHLSDPLSRWLDFRLRYIDPAPRRVFTSNKFPQKLPPTVEAALQHFVISLHNGANVNPYQSKSLIWFNDISTKKRAKRTDLLWADWGISHFHLTDIPIHQDEFFSARECSDGESWLLFCIFVGNTVGLIDVRQHEEECLFSDRSLIEVMKDSWPDYMEQFRLQGILPGKGQFTNFEIQQLRANGMGTPICIDGKVYMGPGMGITSASTPLRVTQKAGNVLDWIERLAEEVDEEQSQFRREVRKLGVDIPQFELAITPHGFAVYEKQANIAFTFTNKPKDDQSVYSARIIDLICPDWVLSKQILNALQ